MKYSIDGHEVCSYIVVQQADSSLKQAGRVVMQLVTNIKGQMYDITFASPELSFDSMMPTFDTMIHSLHFTAAGNSTGGGNALAQSNNSNTTLSLMTSLAKGLATYALRNVTMTTAQCDIARHFPIVPENKTIAKSTSALIGYTAGREAALNACMRVGK